jgi:hypothetical protein
MRAHWPYIQDYLTRGGRCWIATRIVVSPLLWLGHLDPLRLSLGAALEIVALSVGMSCLDTTLRGEIPLIGNLAIHPLTLVSAFASLPALAELAIRLGGNLVR